MPVKLFEFDTTLTRHLRRYCECCDCPTLVIEIISDPRLLDDPRTSRWDLVGTPYWPNSSSPCVLCEWENRPLDDKGDPQNTPSEERNDGITLEQARTNFARFWSIYDPNDLPEWKLSAASPEVQEARQVLRDAYVVLLAAQPGAQKEAWSAVADAERSVRAAVEAQQAADEEQVAGQWDDSEEQTP